MLVIAGTIRIDPAKQDEAVAAAREVTVETHKEPGCKAYRFSLDLDEPGVFHLYEEWDDQAALDAHFEQPHMAVFQQTVGALGVKEMKVRKFEIASVGPVF